MKKVLIVASVVAALGTGLLGGAAVAVIPMILSPAGLSAGDGISTTSMRAPVYPTNGFGETYGSAADAISPETEPQLIRVVATNGKEGYVRKAELDDANGTSAAQNFKSPEEALAWQAGPGSIDHDVNVYSVDGKTVIGTFVVVGLNSQEALSDKSEN